MVEELVAAGVSVASVGLVYVMAGARVVKQYERGVVLRLGRLRSEVRGPGFTMVVPFVDKLRPHFDPQTLSRCSRSHA
ncbi:SPFH domain-containing protein, partial [Streptomyces sp. NPDC006333]|uniref:SPFH domain-containing protein n=1 Tax=Streptomyces sp. NPDC006333 TaxID=3156753 RepID=UPI0033BF7E6C